MEAALSNQRHTSNYLTQQSSFELGEDPALSTMAVAVLLRQQTNRHVASCSQSPPRVHMLPPTPHLQLLPFLLLPYTFS